MKYAVGFDHLPFMLIVFEILIDIGVYGCQLFIPCFIDQFYPGRH